LGAQARRKVLSACKQKPCRRSLPKAMRPSSDMFAPTDEGMVIHTPAVICLETL